MVCLQRLPLYQHVSLGDGASCLGADRENVFVVPNGTAQIRGAVQNLHTELKMVLPYKAIDGLKNGHDRFATKVDPPQEPEQTKMITR